MAYTQPVNSTPNYSQSPSQPNPSSRGMRLRLRNLWKRTFLRGDIAALFIVLGVLWMPAFALDAADWADGLSILLPIVVVALLTSFFLARSPYSEVSALILSTLYGFATIITVHLLALPGPISPTSRLQQLADRISVWSNEVANNGLGTDNLIFALFLSVLFWYLAHNTVWHIFRLDRVWRAVVPPGLVLVINNLYYRGVSNLEYYVIGFMFFALLLIIHSHIEAREYEWYREKVRYPAKLRQYFLRLGATISVVVLALAWVLPTGAGADNWEKVKEFLGGDPFEQISELWNRLFNSLEGQGVASTDYYGGDRLDLSGAVQLSDEPVMVIEVSNSQGLRLYWRSTVFDYYDGRGWDHRRSVRAYKDSSGMTFNVGEYASRRVITQDITMYIRASSLVYAAPQPQELDLPVLAELNCVAEGGSNCVNTGTEADVAIIRGRRTLRAEDEYQAVSSFSVATAEELRNAGTDYPAWVSQMYLQGGDQVSTNLRDLTAQLVTFNNATNPYDKAKTIEYYLRTSIAYDETIPSPPTDRDPIDWFLFEIRRGYCNYYASAMIMMLRSEGIPARMAAGFAQGEYRSDGTYLVKENDAHTWVEVYFPGYGWVEFEPTADELPLDRPGDRSFQNDFPTLTPAPSATSTPFPTNTPRSAPSTPTPTPTFTPTPPPEEDVPGVTATPETQPTLAPTSTPTPEPALTDVSAENNGSFLRTLLVIFSVMVVTILVLLLLVAFVVWWVEYRGLGGLNPIQKAYARMAIYGRWLRIALTDRQTPEERRRVLVEEVPDGEQPIVTITRLFTRDRFGPPSSKEQQERNSEVARQSWSSARLAFIFEKIRRWRGVD